MRLHRRAFLASSGLAATCGALGLRESVGLARVQPDDRVTTTLALRKKQLEGRVRALPDELGHWRAEVQREVDLNAHFSQLEAIRTMTSSLIGRQENLLEILDPQGDREDFLGRASDIEDLIRRSQFIWNFFREKFQLRLDPAYRDALWTADTIAWDCYRPTIEAAARPDMGILPADKLREPPLCYYAAEFSAATWVRGSIPEDLRDRRGSPAVTPIPVIEIPWDHARHPWELVTLAHEVGHDLEADLNLEDPLTVALDAALRAAGVPDTRVEVWLKWRSEIFADLVALQLAGPAYGDTLMQLLLLPKDYVTTYRCDDPHPTPYVRILMNTAYMRTIIPDGEATAAIAKAKVNEDADRLEATWKGMYSDPDVLKDYFEDVPVVLSALMDQRLAVLKDHTVRELVPYMARDDDLIRRTARYLRTGQNPPSRVRPRYVASASRIALRDATEDASAEPATVLETIRTNAFQLVRANAPMGLRAGDTTAAHREFILSFVDKFAPPRFEP